MLTKHIVYLVHGSSKFYDQARMSILTLLDLLIKQHRSEYIINVYCDRPELLPQHEFVSCTVITAKQCTDWRGPLDYVHRIKLEVLRDAAARLSGSFIYVDCDTRWLQLPDVEFAILDNESQSPPIVFMHVKEAAISTNFFPHYFTHLSKYAVNQLAAWNIKPGPWTIWNSGAIGVAHPNATYFFDRALAICDELLPYLKPRIFVEQCALSLLATSHFEVRPLQRCIHHYWNYSYEAPIYLHNIFSSMEPSLTIEQQADFCGKFQWDDAVLHSLHKKPLHRFYRWIAKMQNSYYKRKIDLKAAKLRRNLNT